MAPEAGTRPAEPSPGGPVEPTQGPPVPEQSDVPTTAPGTPATGGETAPGSDTTPGLGLTFHYGREERLRGISVDALKGPQIYAEGVALVGRVPSDLEQWIVDRAGIREPFSELFYANLGQPGSRSLGVVIGVQRAGDRLLTRPVFLPAGAMDAPVSFLPSEAWATH